MVEKETEKGEEDKTKVTVLKKPFYKRNLFDLPLKYLIPILVVFFSAVIFILVLVIIDANKMYDEAFYPDTKSITIEIKPSN